MERITLEIPKGYKLDHATLDSIYLIEDKKEEKWCRVYIYQYPGKPSEYGVIANISKHHINTAEQDVYSGDWALFIDWVTDWTLQQNT